MDRKKLINIIDRIERLEEEKKAVQQDIKEVLIEADSFGLNKKVIKFILKLRRMDTDRKEEFTQQLDEYMNTLENKHDEDEL